MTYRDSSQQFLSITQTPENRWWSCRHPVRTIEAWNSDDVEAALTEVERVCAARKLDAVGFVTEGTTTNVVVELNGGRVTPPVASGLLAGTFRAELLARGEVQEQIVTIDDLRRAQQVWLVNSVHAWRSAVVDFNT